MAEEKHLFGPVASRRLGRSLGVDIVPLKTCTLDCVYCQLDESGKKTIERKDYTPIEAVLAELKVKQAEGLKADYITISGSGEPTLHSRLGELIDGIRKISDIPVAIITNGTLLYRSDVRADCVKADVVLPSLDAGDEQTFGKINRPYKDISIEKLIEGLCAFRNEFTGGIWLEVFLVEGLNTDSEQIAKIKNAIKRIGPDKIQLNTAVRPTAEANIGIVDTGTLQAIAQQLGENCEVIPLSCVPSTSLRTSVRDASCGKNERNTQYDIRNTILSMLKRRPCSLNDICDGLSIDSTDALKHITYLQQHRLISAQQKDETTFFRAN